MPNIVKTPTDLAKAKQELQALAKRATTVQLAADTGIHQSQVSRLLRGQFRRLAPNVRTLLDHASRPVAHSSSRERQKVVAQASVVKAALRTWDATPEGARALIRLLRSVEYLRQTDRSK